MLRLILILILCKSLRQNANTPVTVLQNALDKKLVSTIVTGLGGYQGFCIGMAVKNLTRDSLIILVEAGRRLNSTDDKNQDILVVKEEIIALRSGELKQINVKGYCCQATRHSPAKGAKYDVNVLADSNLVKLARFLNKMEFDKNAEQEAVWAISDQRPAAHIASGNDSLTRILREKVASIKGEELPWYRILSKKHTLQSGLITSIYLRLQAIIPLSLNTESYITLSVRDSNGIHVCEIKSEWLKAGPDQPYKLDIPVKGLAKGEYVVELKAQDQQVCLRKFEI